MSSLLIFALIGPPVGLMIMLGPKRFLVLSAVSAFTPILLIYVLLYSYLLGLLPALLTGLVWAFTRRFGIWLRLAITVGTGIMLTWPIANWFAKLTFVVGGWVWPFGGVSALVCCLVALRRDATLERISTQLRPLQY